MLRKVLALSIILALSQIALSWEPESYEVAARRLCADFGCECVNEVVAGSTKPDTDFRDAPTHHCYKPLMDYSSFEQGAWTKPVLNECPALDKVVVWLDEAKGKSGCRRWHDFGVALHYFLDAKEFWNRVILVNRSCVIEHEDEVNEYLQYGGGDWKSCSCGICVTNNDFVDWLAEYRERIKEQVPAKHNEKPTVVILANDFDGGAAVKTGYYLTNQKVKVIHASPGDFADHKNSEFIVVAGGHMAPGVGRVVDAVLTDKDKALVNKAVFTAEVFKKKNVWVMGQTVYFIAGHGVNETADGLWGARNTLKDTAVEYSSLKPDVGQCKASEDCGTDYYGPWVCSDRERAARVLYKPYCKAGVCLQKGMRSLTRTCRSNEVCLSFLGCVSSNTLPVSDGVYTPMFRSWLSRERATTIIGHDVKLVLYARSYANETLRCEYYDGEWKSMGRLTGNSTATILLNVSANATGKYNMTKRIRCGNVTGSDDDEFRTLYYMEHNYTLMVIPPPMAFTFSLKPGNVTLDDCFDEKNVTIRIENLCSNNITCNYTVGDVLHQVFITRPGVTYNVSERRWTFNRTNVSYTYLSYYSGSDFQNASVRKRDDDGNYYWHNVSQADLDSYANEPKRYSFYNVTSDLKKTSTYYWDIPHWSENVFWVDSDECMLRWVPVDVTCTDEYGQRTTLKKNVYLNYTYD